MAMTTTKLMTAEELLAMPDDGYRYELVRGALIKMAPASFFHGVYGGNIAASLAPYVIRNSLGKVCITDPGFLLWTDPDQVRVPDFAFVSKERIKAAGDNYVYFPGAPDLVVEVISPNDRLTEVAEKVAEWLAAGTRMVVVVNPHNRTAQAHTPDGVTELTEADTLDGGDVVPGWRLPVADIFA